MRIAVYPSDVVELTNRCAKYAQKLIKTIKEKNNIPKDGFVGIKVFCEHTGFDAQEVEKVLNKKNRQ